MPETSDTSPDISVVIPAYNEAGALPGLIAEVIAALAPDHPRFEVLVVDDCSTDTTAEAVTAIAAGDRRLRLIRNSANAGQSASVHNGVLAARGAVICTLDGDGQNPPENLPALIAPLLGARDTKAPALVAGQRVARQDTMSKRLASGLANRIRSAVLKDGTRDTGCGLKAFRRDAFLELPYFDHMHRYLPALFARAGHAVAHVDVSHRPRRAGRSKYTNIGRALVGAVDLLGVAWLIRRRKRARATEVETR